MKNLYPIIPQSATLGQLIQVLQTIQRYRQIEDLPDWDNLNQVFVSGRSSRRIPASAIDVLTTDKIGDQIVAVNGTYLYMLVSVSGVSKWARISLDTGW